MSESTANPDCPFCQVIADDVEGRIIVRNDHAVMMRDGFPISPGHSLIIPIRHVGSFFDTTSEERDSMWKLLEQAKRWIDDEHHPDSYNIGINDGPAAGQTVPHLHVHLIPRYADDVDDPRGGVRWLIPGKARYWGDA